MGAMEGFLYCCGRVHLLPKLVVRCEAPGAPPSKIRMPSSMSCHSVEKLMIDDEPCGELHKLMETARLEISDLADSIKRVCLGSHFLQ